jgi:hypothetical protein
MVDAKPHRWCVYIDILGFSDLWKSEGTEALGALGELMRAIYRIGTRVYPEEGDRLFVHHMGDGFAIVSAFGEPSLERPIAIAIALMRHVTASGAFAAAAIAEGEFSDITGCYPMEVTNGLDDAHVVRLGMGLMTLSSVMGTAFIRAYCLHNVAPSGPFLVLSETDHERVPDGIYLRPTKSKTTASLLSIDWVRARSSILNKIQTKAPLSDYTAETLVQRLIEYCMKYPYIRSKWKNSASSLLDIDL